MHLLQEIIRLILWEKKTQLKKMSERGHTFAMISAYVSLPKRANRLRHRKMLEDIKNLGYYRIYETWALPWDRLIEKGATVSGMSFLDAIMLGRKYEHGLVGFYSLKNGTILIPRSVIETAMPVVSTKRDFYSKMRGLSFEWDLEDAIELPWDGQTEMIMAQVRQILQLESPRLPIA